MIHLCKEVCEKLKEGISQGRHGQMTMLGGVAHLPQVAQMSHLTQVFQVEQVGKNAQVATLTNVNVGAVTASPVLRCRRG
jgi:hypothetical protein